MRKRGNFSGVEECYAQKPNGEEQAEQEDKGRGGSDGARVVGL